MLISSTEQQPVSAADWMRHNTTIYKAFILTRKILIVKSHFDDKSPISIVNVYLFIATCIYPTTLLWCKLCVMKGPSSCVVRFASLCVLLTFFFSFFYIFNLSSSLLLKKGNLGKFVEIRFFSSVTC